MCPLLTLENDHLRVVVDPDGTLGVTDKAHQTRWRTWPTAFQDKSRVVEDVVWTRRERYWADVYMSHFSAEKQGNNLRIMVKGPAGAEKGCFTCMLSLQDEWLLVRIEDIDDSLPSLVFPSPIQCASLVIPAEIGQWLRKASSGMECRLYMQNCGLNMRWAGGLKEDEDKGWMAVFEDAFADSGVYRNGLFLAPIWTRSLGRWGRTRSVRYCFTEGGYVNMAKVFRRYAYDSGIVRSLAQKVDQTPALANLLGGRIVSMFQSSTHHDMNAIEFFHEPAKGAVDGKVDVRISHADAGRIMALAKSWGMQRGLFNLRGTFRGGYDEMHPDIWPPEPLLGTVAELKKLSTHDGSYITALHDNYQDMYQRTPSFPTGVIKGADGQLLHGGYWHGGQCFITCSTQQRAYAERNWKQVGGLGLGAYFIDTAACVQFYECYDPAHPMSRTQDVQAKLSLMEFFKQQGLVLGSENAADFGMYHLDFLENRHAHVPAESIPLWPLVFHDAAFYGRYGTQGTGGGEPVRQLENYLWGYLCYYPADSLEHWEKQESRFRETLALDAFHARVGMDEMVCHKYLTDDRLVEQTEFSSGVSVIANFAREPRQVGGRTVPAEGHVVLG